MQYKRIIEALVVQGFGSISTILATLIIANRAGAEGQGVWALLKSTSEFLGVILAFGFPASASYLVHKLNISPKSILRAAILFVVVATAVALLIDVIWTANHVPSRGKEYTSNDQLFVGATAVTMSLYSIYRGLILSVASQRIFNYTTTVLPVSICLVFLLGKISDPSEIYVRYLFAAVASMAIAQLFWSRAARICPTGEQRGAAEITKLSAPNFLAALAPYLYTYLVFQWLKYNNFGVANIGVFSIALLIQGAALLIPNIAGPLLYKEWTCLNAADVYASYRSFFISGIATAVSILLGAVFFLDFLVERFFASEFAASVMPSIIVLLSLPFSFAARILLNACMAAGRVNAYSSSVFAKCVFIFLLLQIFQPASANAAAIILSVAEAFGFLFLVFSAKRSMQWSYARALGLEKAGD